MPAFFWMRPEPSPEGPFDWSDWKGILGTAIGALLGFGMSYLQRRIEEERSAARQAAAAALTCLERLRSFEGDKTIGAEELRSLQLDLTAYRNAMLTTARSRRRHSAAYESVHDILGGFDAESLSTAIGELKAVI